jgi:putative transposase
MTTHEYVMGVRQRGWAPFRGRLWQRNYHEHIVRNEIDLRRIREYIIIGNPARWNKDENNPALLNFRR